MRLNMVWLLPFSRFFSCLRPRIGGVSATKVASFALSFLAIIYRSRSCSKSKTSLRICIVGLIPTNGIKHDSRLIPLPGFPSSGLLTMRRSTINGFGEVDTQGALPHPRTDSDDRLSRTARVAPTRQSSLQCMTPPVFLILKYCA